MHVRLNMEKQQVGNSQQRYELMKTPTVYTINAKDHLKMIDVTFTEISSYTIGAIKQDANTETFKGMSL